MHSSREIRMSDVQHAVRAAIARAGRAEPAMHYAGHTYTESALRQLQDSGNLQALGELAPLAADFLRRVEWARRPTYGPSLRLITLSDESAPVGITYSVPAGWSHTHIALTYVDAAEEEDRYDA
jgi:hypothetical protein